MQMGHGKNVNPFSIATVDNGVRKAINDGPPNRQPDWRAGIGILADQRDGSLNLRGKQPPQPRNP